MISVISEKQTGTDYVKGYYTIKSDEQESAILDFCIKRYKSLDNYVNGVLHREPYGLELAEYNKQFNEAQQAGDFNRQIELAGKGWYHLEKQGDAYLFTTFHAVIN